MCIWLARLFLRWKKIKSFTSFFYIYLWFFLDTPTRGQIVYFTLLIDGCTLYGYMFTSHYTSRKVLLWCSHVVLKWKISWLKSIKILTTDWWGKYTSGIYQFIICKEHGTSFTIVIYCILHMIGGIEYV